MESRNLRTIGNYSPWYVFVIYFAINAHKHLYFNIYTIFCLYMKRLNE